MLDLPKIAVHDRTIDDRIVVRPKNHVSDFVRCNESTETVHGAELIENPFVMANMLAQHGGVGESGADQRSVDSPSHEVLAGRSHHAQLRVFAYDVTERTRNGFFRQCRADVKNAGLCWHLGEQGAIQRVDAYHVDGQNLPEVVIFSRIAAILQHQCRIVD